MFRFNAILLIPGIHVGMCISNGLVTLLISLAYFQQADLFVSDRWQPQLILALYEVIQAFNTLG